MQRPFGGMNVLFSGDVWQLPPPEGGCLGDIPVEYIRNARKYATTPCIAHGQSLLWSDDVETGLQGVTELQECISLRKLDGGDACAAGREADDATRKFPRRNSAAQHETCTLRSRQPKAQPTFCEELAKVTVDRESV